MAEASALRSKYRLKMSVSCQQEPPHEERRSFLWKRTHHVKAGDTTTPMMWSTQNYKLVDEPTGELLAAFTWERSFSKCGTPQLKAELEESFETMAILSYLSLYEKARRRDRSAGAGDGGGC